MRLCSIVSFRLDMHISPVDFRLFFQFLDHLIGNIVRREQSHRANHIDMQVNHQARAGIFAHQMVHPLHARHFGGDFHQPVAQFGIRASTGEETQVLPRGIV